MSLPPLDTNIFNICLPNDTSESNGLNPQNKTYSDAEYAVVRTHVKLYSSATVDNQYDTITVVPPHSATPRRVGGGCRGIDDGRERQVRQSINHAQPKLNTCVPHAPPTSLNI